ncbi:hypothetical protein BGZ94_008752 [Podila epigama]|nr:hypothetical protein BGZ94_008752 [Podila epigama]
MPNSELQPVDLTASLASLRNTTYVNDYTFHAKLSHMIAQLQDPHTTYRNMCYQQFLFIQPLSTYGVFENGRQQVKVATVLNKLDPRLDSGLVDCEVTHIDDEPAFQGNKDKGVRLNKAFSFLAHDKTGSHFDRYSLGTFAQRTSIPPKSTIKYTIDCQGKHDPRKPASTTESEPLSFHLAWSALDATMAPFTDASSYRKQFCSADSIQTVKKFVLDTAAPDDFSKLHLHSGRQKSRELYRGPYASFHMLSDGETAVFRLGTESPNKMDTKRDGFYNNIDRGFAILESVGATKLIIDLQSNSGGIICWGRYVLQTLFPQTVDAPYIYNLKSSRLAQALTQATFWYDQGTSSPYEGLVDPKTGEEVVDASWMIPGVPLPGREGAFSQQVTDRFCPVVEEIKGREEDALFSPENIVILTNGFCGSTCAVLALQLHERYGVKTVAIGGEHGEPMMFTSFPGGAVQANNTQWVRRVRSVYETLPTHMKTKELEAMVPKQLPANGQLAFTFREVMSASRPDQVSEYMHIPSNFRMDYTSSRFRLPSILWDDVRQEVWGRDGDGQDDSVEGDWQKEKEKVDDEEEGGDEEEEEQEWGIHAEEDGDGQGAQSQVDIVTAEADRQDLEWLAQQVE